MYRRVVDAARALHSFARRSRVGHDAALVGVGFEVGQDVVRQAEHSVQISIQRVPILLGPVLLALVGAYFWYIFHRGELADAPYGAALQSIEYRSRSNRDPSPLLEVDIDGAGTDAIGVPGRDGARTRVWVILSVADSEAAPMVLPQRVPFGVGCDELERKLEGRKVLPAVRQFLFSGCSPNPR